MKLDFAAEPTSERLAIGPAWLGGRQGRRRRGTGTRDVCSRGRTGQRCGHLGHGRRPPSVTGWHASVIATYDGRNEGVAGMEFAC